MIISWQPVDEDLLDWLENAGRTALEAAATDALFLAVCLGLESAFAATLWLGLP